MLAQPFRLEHDAVMIPYTAEAVEYCTDFDCGDSDLNEFFSRDALPYDAELLGKTYAWVDYTKPSHIIGMITLANDSIKARHIASNARNRLQRNISNVKRGRSYPAVLIGRLGVATDFRGKGYNVGSQILKFIKDWFRTKENKTGCRFIVVDAYNNDKTLHFYEKNGFKPLYRNEIEEREFLGLPSEHEMPTRFYYYDLKWESV